VSEPHPSPPAAPVPPASDEALYAALVKADRSEALVPQVAGLAHGLNDLLTRILSGVTLARQQGAGESLAQAEEACLAAREITRQMLTLGRAGPSATAAVAPQDLLDEAAKMAGTGIAAEITVTLPPGIPTVAIDRSLGVQAFQNLVRNAVEALSPTPPRPQIQLRAAAATLAEGQVAGLGPGEYVEFEVRDNGAGISPELLEKIWEPFFTTKKHGAGLGLPTALAIIRRHGGQIGVDTAVGVGSVFTIFLPCSVAAVDVGGVRAPTARFRTGRILVMDDDEHIRTLTGALLEKLDYHCDLARDGADAVVAYKRYFDVGRPYDAVILDLTVARGMGGEEAFVQLRGIDPEVRAIATAAGGADLQSARCLELGFCGWLAKPYRLAELGSALQTVLH
jgi:two-component system cell cycle sensor histidine kinase/response regulator CckA